MTKQVQLSDDAYARLAAEKQPGESFSDVVVRLTRKISLVEALRGTRTKEEIEEHHRMVAKIDKLDQARAKRPRGSTIGRR